NLSQTKYAGKKPEDVLKGAWDDLLKPMNMRFTQDELVKVNQESVALPEGGGYLGGHVHHCIELLRQEAMCQPDTSLTSFLWHPTTNLPMFNVSESTHTCADWDAFMETTKSRVVSEEEMKRLKNPLLDRHSY
ncbi:hypothetical protein DM02DRAFT_538705, partial [Periconia macrospinosa]